VPKMGRASPTKTKMEEKQGDCPIPRRPHPPSHSETAGSVMHAPRETCPGQYGPPTLFYEHALCRTDDTKFDTACYPHPVGNQDRDGRVVKPDSGDARSKWPKSPTLHRPCLGETRRKPHVCQHERHEKGD
jgi:hypothetical protein